MNLGYEYFAGANVIVEIEGMPLLEAVGISLNISESKRPIYGYSSRHFDAVARGQVIVQGALVVNYVHQDYLLRAIELGLQSKGLLVGAADTLPGFSSELESLLDDAFKRDAIASEVLTNYPENTKLAQALKDRYWTSQLSGTKTRSEIPNPHDSFGGNDILITFGERNVLNQNKGITALLLSDVYFTGRGVPIRIDEEAIVEEYPFFARNIQSVAPRYITTTSTVDPDDGRILFDPVSTVESVA